MATNNIIVTPVIAINTSNTSKQRWACHLFSMAIQLDCNQPSLHCVVKGGSTEFDHVTEKVKSNFQNYNMNFVRNNIKSFYFVNEMIRVNKKYKREVIASGFYM